MRSLAALPLLLGALPALAPAPALAIPPAPAPAMRAQLVGAMEVLDAWDDRRALAWAESDVDALRALYMPGSAAGAADVRLLRAYRHRGVVVRRLVTQVFAVHVLRRDTSTMELRVSDRVAGGELVRAGRSSPLTSSPPVVRTVELRRTAGGWRVVTVSESGRALPSRRR